MKSVAAVMIAAAISQIAAAQAPSKNFVVYEAPRPISEIRFGDAQGQTRRLDDFKGRIVVLNIWATWCVPCREEMPALDRLQGSLGGTDFMVVPLSIDRGGVDSVAKFYSEIGIRDLPIYIDPSGKAFRELGAVGLPTTLILDRGGKEMARVVGPAEWDSPEIAEFLTLIILK